MPVLISLCLFVAAPHLCRAATVDVLEVPLKVDAVTKLPEGMLRIVLFGEERITTAAQIPAFVLTSYIAHNGAASARTTDWENIVRNGLKAGDLKSSSDALLLLMSHPELTPSGEEVFLNSLSPGPQSHELFRSAIIAALPAGKMVRGNLVAPVLYRAAVTEPSWARQNVARLVYRFFDEIKGYLRDKFVGAFSGQSNITPDEILSLMKVLFGDNDADVKDLDGILQRLHGIRKALKSEDHSEALAVLGQARSGTGGNPVLAQIIARIVLEEAQEMVLRGASADALILLSRARVVEVKTPQVLNLVLRSVQSLGDTAVLGNKEVWEMVLGCADRDAQIKEALIQVLERSSLERAESGDFTSSEAAFNALISVRPDPDTRNDEIRIAQVKRLLSEGLENQAVQKLASVRMPFRLKDRLWFAQYRLLHKTPLWIAILVFLVLACVTYVRHASLKKQRDRERTWKELGWQDAPTAEEDGEKPRTFIVKELRSPVEPAIQEYFACLHVFSLKPGASTREIKTAYRRKMKEVHPDMNAGDEELSSREFIRIRRAYERLLKLEEEAIPLQFRS